ncbi:hypothetical protein DXG01_002089, partial [Tephrocybe rancida]
MTSPPTPATTDNASSSPLRPRPRLLHPRVRRSIKAQQLRLCTLCASCFGSVITATHCVLGADDLVEQQMESNDSRDDPKEKEKTHPSEWDVPEVVEWLKGKGFDLDVYEKFTGADSVVSSITIITYGCAAEQEITGDVLLELDVNHLKTELGIMAFGKCMRIANAITDLRRPPPSSTPTTYFPMPVFPAHPRGTRATNPKHTHTTPSPGRSVLFLPLGPGPGQVGVGRVYIGPGAGGVMYSPETMYAPSLEQVYTQNNGINNGNGELSPEPAQMGLLVSATAINGKGANVSLNTLLYLDGKGSADMDPVGPPGTPCALPERWGAQSECYGCGGGQCPRGREVRPRCCERGLFPPHLPPSDSDAHDINLKSEAAYSTSMRRRLFGRSYDSANSKLDSASRHSKKGAVSASASPIVAGYKKDKNGDKDRGDKEKEKDTDSLGPLRPQSKKSTDSTGTEGVGERLSIFGSTFSGTLGKGRKPPPRYPAAIEETHIEKPSHSPHAMFTLPRLTSNSRKASGHDRPPSTSTTGTATPKSTPKPTPKSAYKEAP